MPVSPPASEPVPRPSEPKRLLEPISNPRVSDVVAERIARAIRDEPLRPGDRLPTEHELARQLGVGRTSVREGLQKLRAFGIVEIRKGLGAYVANGEIEDPLVEFARWTATSAVAIEQLLEARIALETLAAALAAVRASDDEIATIAAHHRAHADAGEAGDVTQLVRTDETFHEAIAAAARNQLVSHMYAVLIPELTDFRRKTLALPWAAPRSTKGHAAIVEAIGRHDAVAARRAMLDHLYVLYTEVSEYVSTDGGSLDLPLAPREALA